jgi:hypothetical protein
MVAAASVANASSQVDSWGLADDMTTDVPSTQHGTLASSERRSSSSAATLDRAVTSIIAASLSATGCQLDADGSVCVVPAGHAAALHAGAQKNAPSTASRGAGVGSSRPGRPRPSAAVGVSSATDGSGDAAGPRRASAVLKQTTNLGIGVSSASDTSGSVASGGQVVVKGDDVDTGVASESVPPLDAANSALASRVLSSHALLESLTLAERAVQQNLYHDAHRRYRGGPAVDVLEGLLSAGARCSAFVM